MAAPEYRPWFEREKERFEEEKADMAARGFTLNDDTLQRAGLVEFQGLSASEPDRPLRVAYPDTFPSAPPMVFSEKEGRLLRRHQRPDSWELCLFGRQQGRWRADLSGTTAIDEAEEVLRLFGVGAPPVPGDDVPEPASAIYSYHPDAVVLIPPAVAGLELFVAADTIGSFRIRYNPGAPGGKGGRGIVTGAQLGIQRARDEFAPLGPWPNGGPGETGTLINLAKSPPPMGNLAELEGWMRQNGLPMGKHGRLQAGWLAFVFPEESGVAGQQRHAWLVVRVPINRQVQFLRTFTLRQDERDVRVPGLGGLTLKNVVVVGCGSLGSKIAASLAASGVGAFGLVDPDILEPANILRHEAGIDSVGLHKTQALALRLRNINPHLSDHMKGLNLKIGSINSPTAEKLLYEMIAEADLVINATWSHASARYINETCHDLGVPSLQASVTDGAWGGEVVRVIPQQTACWLCWLEQYEHERPAAAPTPPEGVFGPGCNQPTFTGTTYEIGMVANLAAWMAVETLLRGEGERQDMPGNYIRWTGRTQTGVPQACAEFLPTVIQAGCPICRHA